MNNLSLRVRLFVLVGLGILGTLLVGSVALYSSYSLLMQARIDQTRAIVESLATVVADLQANVKAGSITEEEAKAKAIMTIKAVRYGDNDYFWINDTKPRMVMHAIKPELDGKDLSNLTDPNGKKLFIEFVEVTKNNGGAGVVDYMWPKPGSEHPQPKVSYVQAIPGWDWIIGTGIYVDDVWQDMLREAAVLGTIFLGIVAVVLLAATAVTRSILGPISSFAKHLHETSQHLEISLKEAHEATSHLASAANETSSQSNKIRQNSQEADRQVASVHTALEELNTSISDISQNVQSVNAFVHEAVQKARRTGDVVGNLNNTTQKISEVVTLITTLAEQTNLLALNAAIEAARAGEAGRGFAVVADEVKKLATNTANATGEIGENVAAIKRVAEECVRALNEVTTAVNQIQDNTTAMSAAVEEQSSVVKNVAENMRATASSVTHVTHSIQGIEHAVNESSAATQQLSASSAEINNTFSQLNKQAQQTFSQLGLVIRAG